MEFDHREVPENDGVNNAGAGVATEREQALNELDSLRKDLYKKRLQYWLLALALLLALVATPTIAERWAYSTRKRRIRREFPTLSNLSVRASSVLRRIRTIEGCLATRRFLWAKVQA